MNFGLQILTGIIIGCIFGIFSIASIINKEEKELLLFYKKLTEALNIRYLKLKNVLNFLKKHMDGFHQEIDNLIRLCDDALNIPDSIENIDKKLEYENNINYKLEDIKSNMEKFPSIKDDDEVNSAVLAIAESEIYAGDAIEKYNAKNLAYKTLNDLFPISAVAKILNKKTNIIPFLATEVQEFDDSYINEDDI